MNTPLPRLPTPSDLPSARFATTHWSIVCAAQGASTEAAAVALEELCRTYWFPLYGYARRRGHSPHDAEDLTQAFYALFLEKGYVLDADRSKGRFRTFLLVAFKRFLANAWDKQQAQKRGGGAVVVPLDTTWAETIWERDHADSLPEDAAYEKHWALTLMERAMTSLRAEYESGGTIAEFERLKPCLTTDRDNISYPEIAAAMQITEAGARSAVHRIRKRFREIFRGTIAATLSNSDDIEDEMRQVIRALSAS